ncbi:MAG: D-alanyl-D-alanine carboxypeptidase [Clostridia bacterium]|nr:D-alanyl-D-alanine carboxypeptidase [Clostridia bacterium]
MVKEVSNEALGENFLNIESESCILIEQTTGKVLYEKNSHEKLRPASVTKVMTILLIMEALDSGKIALTDTVPCSENATSMGGSQIWLDSRELLTVDEMLKAICVVSANDCTVAMAEFLAGSEEVFVGLMNEKAKTLGMNDTTFKNCHGIDEEGHITTAYDISLMSRELLQKHPNITKYSTIWMDSLRNGQSSLVNTNKLVRNYKGCTGLKTGSTSLALYNLSASATRDDLSLLAVVLKGGTSNIRFNDAKKLLDYGFTNFKFEKGATKGKVVQSITIDKSVEKELNLVYEKDSGVLVPKSSAGNIEQEVVINDKISAPIQKGEILGTVHFYLDGQILDSVNLVAEQDITKLSVFSMYSYIIGAWMNLLR